jgi:integrase
MASFYERGQGQWEARVRKTGWKPQRRTFSNKARAMQWATKVEQQMDAGTFVEVAETRRMLLRQLIQLYKDKVAPTLEDCNEKIRIADEIDEEFGLVGVLNLTPKQIAEWMERLEKSGRKGKRAASTVNHYVNTLSAVYQAGMKKFHMPIPHNPCKLVERRREPPPRTQKWQDNEIDLLIAANVRSNEIRRSKGGREPFGEFEWFLRLGLQGAMRRGEIARLSTPHINLEERTAHLPKTKNKTPRTIPLSSIAIKILRQAITLRSGDPLPDGRLFRLSVDGFKSAFRRARDEVIKTHPELRLKRFHDTRRTATTRLAKKLDIVELSSTTGIKTLRILQTYYQPDPAEMAKKLD